VVPLAWSGLAATGGDDIPACPAWSTSSTTRTGDWGVVEQINAGAHLSSTGQTCPSMALHPSHAMSTASVPGPDSIAANLNFAPIAASAPTLHDVTAAGPALTAWLLHHLFGLLCEAVFFWIPLDIIWWLFADRAFVALQCWLLMTVHFCTMGMHFCSTMWALLGSRRNAMDNLIHLFLFANVIAVALFAVGKCLITVKTKLDTFNEVALLRALVLVLGTVVLWPMLFGSSGRSTAPTLPPGPDP